MAKAKKVKEVPTNELEKALLEFDSLLQTQGNLVLKALEASPLTFSAKRGAEHTISTDSLCLDLIMGGGVPKHRMTIFSGASYTGKTTVLQRVMKNALGYGINSHYIDQEGSADPVWMLRNGFNFEKFMETKGTARKLTVVPDIRSGDDAFRYMSRVCEAYIAIMSKNPEIAKLLESRGYPALAHFLDSLPACIPEALVDNDEASAMAAQARMFSLMIPLVRTKLKAANGMFVTVNQLRTKPGVTYGDPDYEPGGQAPNFYSDVKIRFKPVSKAKEASGDGEHALINKDNIRAGGIHVETNPNGSTDEYKYISLTSTKNRVFSPFLTTYMRIWTDEDGRPGRGIDPVFDTLYFYENLGMLTYETVRGQGKLINFEGKTYKYSDLKSEVLKDSGLRDRAYEMMKTGEAFEKFFEFRSTGDEEIVEPSVELEKETDEAYKQVEESVKELEQAADKG